MTPVVPLHWVVDGEERERLEWHPGGRREGCRGSRSSGMPGGDLCRLKRKVRQSQRQPMSPSARRDRVGRWNRANGGRNLAESPGRWLVVLNEALDSGRLRQSSPGSTIMATDLDIAFPTLTQRHL